MDRKSDKKRYPTGPHGPTLLKLNIVEKRQKNVNFQLSERSLAQIPDAVFSAKKKTVASPPPLPRTPEEPSPLFKPTSWATSQFMYMQEFIIKAVVSGVAREASACRSVQAQGRLCNLTAPLFICLWRACASDNHVMHVCVICTYISFVHRMHVLPFRICAISACVAWHLLTPPPPPRV